MITDQEIRLRLIEALPHLLADADWIALNPAVTDDPRQLRDTINHYVATKRAMQGGSARRKADCATDVLQLWQHQINAANARKYSPLPLVLVPSRKQMLCELDAIITAQVSKRERSPAA